MPVFKNPAIKGSPELSETQTLVMRGIFIRIKTQIHVYIYIHTYVYIHMYIYMCLYTCVYIRMYVHTYRPPPPHFLGRLYNVSESKARGAIWLHEAVHGLRENGNGAGIQIGGPLKKGVEDSFIKDVLS